MNVFRKALAYLSGHSTALRVIANRVFAKFGAEFVGATPQERGEKIRDAVKAYLKAKYPEYSTYESVIVDYVYTEVRKALAKK